MSNPKPTLLLIYGQGGHCAEMNAFVSNITAKASELEFVSLGDGRLKTPVLAHFEAQDIRSKHSRLKNLVMTLPLMFSQLFTVMKIIRRYNVCGVVSTGPGLCIMPMLLCRILGVKTVFIETYCRFDSYSMTGRVMSKFVHRFLIQNKQLQRLYPKAEYCGRL